MSDVLAAPAGIADPAVSDEGALRAFVWTWLGSLFATAPDVAAVAAYRRGDGAGWLARLAAVEGLADGVAAMREALAGDRSDAEVTAAICTAYGRLFLGIGGPDTVAPYESGWRGDGRLFQAPTGEMETLLAAHDLSVGGCEPADHLSVELALMAHLTFAGDPDAAVLLDRIEDWVPAFCADCMTRDRSGFWAGAASVLAALIATETRALRMTRH